MAQASFTPPCTVWLTVVLGKHRAYCEGGYQHLKRPQCVLNRRRIEISHKVAVYTDVSILCARA
jgi:hypothetical protein